MRTVVSILLVVCVVMALPLGLLAWDDESNGHYGVGCPVQFNGKWNGIYYFYVQSCTSGCPFTAASSTRMHVIDGHCNGCPGTVTVCSDPISLTGFYGSPPDLGHIFESPGPLADYVPKKPDPGTTPAGTVDPAFFYPSSTEVVIPSDGESIVTVRLAGGGGNAFIRLIDVVMPKVATMRVGQQLQEMPQQAPLVYEVRSVAHVADHCYVVTVDRDPGEGEALAAYYVRTVAELMEMEQGR